jgi:transposase-like protein
VVKRDQCRQTENIVNACDFKDFFVGLTLLSRRQRQRVVAFLQVGSGGDKAVEVIEAAATARAVCPHCAITALYRHGKSHGLQRYRCRGCGKTTYRAFAREAGFTHAAVNLRAGVRTRGAVHVQNVNAHHGRFHQWLSRFNGVATRYLRNYLAWRQVHDAGTIDSSAALLKAAIGLFNS